MTGVRSILLIVAALHFVCRADADYVRCVRGSTRQCISGISCGSAGTWSPTAFFQLSAECLSYKISYLVATPSSSSPYYTLTCRSDLQGGCPAGSNILKTYKGSTADTDCTTEKALPPTVYQWCYDFSQPASAEFGTCQVPSTCTSPKKRIGGFTLMSNCFDVQMSCGYVLCSTSAGAKCRPKEASCKTTSPSETYRDTFSGTSALSDCEAAKTGLNYQLCYDPTSSYSGTFATCEPYPGACASASAVSLYSVLGKSNYPTCGDLYRKLNGKPHVPCTNPTTGYTRCRLYKSSETLKGCNSVETPPASGPNYYPTASDCHATLNIVCSGGTPSVADGNCFCVSATPALTSTDQLCPSGDPGVYVSNLTPQAPSCAALCPASTSQPVVVCTVTCSNNNLDGSTSSRTESFCIPFNDCIKWNSYLPNAACTASSSLLQYPDLGQCLDLLTS